MLKMLERQPNRCKVRSVDVPKLFYVTPLAREEFPTDKKPPKTRFKNLKRYFGQYCEESTIHGVKYIGQSGRPFLEKLIWTVIVTFLCTICMMLIREAYLMWRSSPVTVTFKNKETPISRIPFPAVTLCPDIKFDPEKFNFTGTILKKRSGAILTAQEEEYLQIAILVCEPKIQCRHYLGLTGWNDTVTNASNKLLEVMSPLDPHNLISISWLGKSLNLSALPLTLTSEGICHTFNMLPYEEIVKHHRPLTISRPKHRSHKWTLERGYPPGQNLHAFPRRTFMPGIDGGFALRFLYTNHSHIDYLCGESLQGYKVALHHPSEFPNMDKHFRLPLDQAVFVAIKPSMITVSNELLNYPPKVRECYFDKERNLSSYLFYTQSNCLNECLANYTSAHCRCIPFYLALLDTNLKICGPGQSQCVKESKLRYLENETDTDREVEKCECLPSCTSLSYDVETSQSDWRWQKVTKVLQFPQLKHINSDKYAKTFISNNIPIIFQHALINVECLLQGFTVFEL
ncbi:hypothetical protein RI129_010216 [Pyrocoelia pectoralis]|uniref:Uncharacterized protein n=1 Tax=Pyrocoelia pectoralis TaxID=417401 RepID=A0AAN7VD17_9COLE